MLFGEDALLVTLFNTANLFFLMADFPNPIRIQLNAVDLVEDIPEIVSGRLDGLLDFFKGIEDFVPNDLSVLLAANPSAPGECLPLFVPLHNMQ